MMAHIVGGGFGGLAAANPQDIAREMAPARATNRLIPPIMMIIAPWRRAVRTKCIDRDNYVGHQKTVLWPQSCISMNSCVAANAKSSIDGQFGGIASRYRNSVGREQ